MFDNQATTNQPTEKTESPSSRQRYLADFVEKYKKFKSPTDNQKLLIKLAEMPNISEDDSKKLEFLLTAEIRKKQAYDAEKKFKALVNADKKKADNELKQRKIVAGAGLLGGIAKGANVNGVSYTEILKDMIARGFISDRDRNIFNDVTTPQEQNHIPQ